MGTFDRSKSRTKPGHTHIYDKDPPISDPVKGGGERRQKVIGRTSGSAEPTLKPVQVRLGGKRDLILPTSVTNIPMWGDGGNRPQEL